MRCALARTMPRSGTIYSPECLRVSYQSCVAALCPVHRVACSCDSGATAFACCEPPAVQKGAAMAPHQSPPAIVALNLGLALVATSNVPLLLLDGRLTIMAASKSFCRAFQIDPAKVEGRLLSELGAGEWNKPQLNSLLHATASGYAEIEGYEVYLKREGRPDRCLVLNAQKLSYSGDDDMRLILSVTDITEARIAEKIREDLLVREKDVLLFQELRVTESLTASKLSPACSCRMPARCSPTKPASIWSTPISALCRLPPCRSNSPPRVGAMWNCVPISRPSVRASARQ